jgi:hypothetical protein
MSRQQWLARQLLPRGGKSVAEVVARGGWMHTAGGTGPYLAFRARLPEVDRQQIDDAVYRAMEVVEVPAVRQSTMLVPRADIGVALAAGRRAFKAEIGEEELERIGGEILPVLVDGACTASQIRKEVSARDLQPALRWLWLQGRILRIAERLDADRYSWKIWPKSLPIPKVTGDLDRELAARFLAWAAPATADDFAWWSGIGKRQARAAMDALRVDDPPPCDTRGIVLLPFRDNLFNLRRSIAPFVDDEEAEVLDWKNRVVRATSLESLHQNAILADGALVGVWEFDQDAERIVARTFGAKPRGLDAAIRETERFIREQLGDHRYYALDTATSREPRLAFVRTMNDER